MSPAGGAPAPAPGEGAALGAAVLASAMAFVDATALNVALPALQRGLGASGAELLWVVNAYALVVAALLLVGGALGDRFGRRRVLAAGIALFAAASAACGLAPTTGALIAARTVQGLGAALLIPGSLALLSATFPAERRGRAVGAWSAWTVVATAFGPVLGGLLAQAGHWRAIFYLNLPFALVALGLLRRVPESRGGEEARQPLDLAGSALAVAGLAGITAAALRAPERGLADPWTAGCAAGGVLALLLFLGVERRAPAPLLPLPLLRAGRLSGPLLVTVLVYAAFHGLLLFLPLHLVQAQGYDAAHAGLTQLPVMAVLVLLSRPAGALLDRFGPRLPLTVGPALSSLGFLGLAHAGGNGPADFWSRLLPPLLLVGAGLALTMAPLSATVLAALPGERSGLASGLNATASRLAGVLAVALLGAMALGSFRAALEARGAERRLPPATREALLGEAKRYGAAQAPSGLPPEAAQEARMAIRSALGDSFSRVCMVSAGLCAAGALAAALTLRRRA